MTDNNQEILIDKYYDLFNAIAKDIKTNPAKYTEAGKCLDEYCSEDAYWQRQKNNLNKLQAQIHTLPVELDMKRLKKEFEVKRTPALLIRFQEAINNLIEKYKDQQFTPEEDARRIIIITWLLTDPDAEKANVNITELEKWPWKPIDDATKMSRGYANFLWFHGGTVYGPWMNLVQIALAKLSEREQNKVSTTKSNRIVDDTWSIAGMKVNLKNLFSIIRNLCGWKKYIAYGLLLLLAIFALGYYTRTFWSPLVNKADSNSGKTSTVNEQANRPFVIFDANEAIHFDGGAMQYLEKIEVETGTRSGSIVPVKISITPKHHLSYPPLIETLGAERFMFTPTPKRGKGHQWVFECEVQHWQEHATKPISFRLEILR